MLLSRVLLQLASVLLSAAQSTTTSSAVPTHTVAVGAVNMRPYWLYDYLKSWLTMTRTRTSSLPEKSMLVLAI